MNAEHLYKRHHRLFRKLPKRMRFKGGGSSVAGLVDLCAHLPTGATGIEIGSFAGESALIFVECGVARLLCVDLWAVNGWYRNEKITPAAEMFDHVAALYPGRIEKHQGRSTDLLPALASTGLLVDFVYIDGDHAFESVTADIEVARPLLKPGGLLCGHDYGRALQNEGVTRAVNALLGGPDAVFGDHSWLKRL